MIKFSDKSLERMKGLHPDLLRVLHRAAEMATPEEDFLVIEGVRSKEQMCINYGKGRTAAQCLAKGVDAKYARPDLAKVTWLNNPLASNHGVQKDGFGHAVDLGPYPLDWNNIAGFKKMVALIKRAAAAEKVNVVCGADWKKADYPHVELA